MTPLIFQLQPAQLREEMVRLHVDPGGVAIMTDKTSALCVRLFDIPCGAANILKQNLLSAGGDAAVPRGCVSCKFPTTDVIFIATRRQLKRALSCLHGQPFKLHEMAERILSSLAQYDAPPAEWGIRDGAMPLDRPCVMGILNVTPDSFSDGGAYPTPDAAVARARQMIDEGADIIDVGGESTRPGAKRVAHDEEIARVTPVIATLARETRVPLSIDTRNAAVARAALEAGARIVNDVSALGDPGMAEIAKEFDAGIVLMHMHGAPDTMQDEPLGADGIVETVARALDERIAAARAAGIEQGKIAVDPGIGFGKTLEANERLVNRLDAFRSFGMPVLIGVSRKRFIGERTEQEPPARMAGSLAANVVAAMRGAQIIRTHDVRETRDALAVVAALKTA